MRRTWRRRIPSCTRPIEPTRLRQGVIQSRHISSAPACSVTGTPVHSQIVYARLGGGVLSSRRPPGPRAFSSVQLSLLLPPWTSWLLQPLTTSTLLLDWSRVQYANPWARRSSVDPWWLACEFFFFFFFTWSKMASHRLTCLSVSTRGNVSARLTSK